MKSFRMTLLAALAALTLAAGCSSISLENDCQKATRHFRQDVLNFYDSISDAYFILGYEYYELSREFEKKGNPEKASYYDDKATIYYNLSRDMKNAAAETRRFPSSDRD